MADEMGMGKTIELIGLVLANPAGKLPKMDNYFPTKATLSKFERERAKKLTQINAPSLYSYLSEPLDSTVDQRSEQKHQAEDGVVDDDERGQRDVVQRHSRGRYVLARTSLSQFSVKSRALKYQRFEVKLSQKTPNLLFFLRFRFANRLQTWWWHQCTC